MEKNNNQHKLLACFDLDGTLYDTRIVNFKSYQYALKQFGYDLSYDFFTQNCNGKHYKSFLPALMGNSKDHIEEVHVVKTNAYSKFLGDAKRNDHLFAILNSIRDSYNTALVTTASSKNTMDLLNFFGDENYFDLILTQEDIIMKKPNPEGYNLAMHHFGNTPFETIIFEDSEAGIEAAWHSGAFLYVVKGFA